MDTTSPGNEARAISAPASPSVLCADPDLVGGGADRGQFREPEARWRSG
ncbi:hypothetical protein [Rhodococcus sp. NPDC127528]